MPLTSKLGRAGAALCCLLACLPALAQPAEPALPPERIEAWLETEWARCSAWPRLDDLVVRWRVEFHYVPGDDALAKLRAEIAGKPGHPRAWQLSEYERRRATGEPLIRRYTLRTRGEQSWRIGEDAAGLRGAIPFLDRVMTPDYAWKLTPTWLIRLDPTEPMPNGHPVDRVGRQVTDDLFWIFRGGMGFAARLGLEPGPVTVDDDHWSFRARSPDGEHEMEFHGVWRDDLDRGFVTAVRVNSGPNDAFTWTLHGWSFSDELARWVASRVERFAPDGQREQVVVLESIEREPPERFARVMAMPDFGATDELRGELALESITDYTADPPVERILNDNGVIEEFDLSLPVKLAERGERDYRRLGWSVAGVVMIALVLVRLRKWQVARRLSVSLRSQESVT
jgi:hypothetical protein